MKMLPTHRSPSPKPDRADLLRQARGVFGVDSTMQIFGSDGRIIADDARNLGFSEFDKLERLIAAEHEAPPPRPALRW